MKYINGRMYFLNINGSRYTRAAWLLDIENECAVVKMVDSGVVRHFALDSLVAGPLGPITEEVVKCVTELNFGYFSASERELTELKRTVTAIAEATGVKAPKKREFNLPSSK